MEDSLMYGAMGHHCSWLEKLTSKSGETVRNAWRKTGPSRQRAGSASEVMHCEQREVWGYRWRAREIIVCVWRRVGWMLLSLFDAMQSEYYCLYWHRVDWTKFAKNRAAPIAMLYDTGVLVWISLQNYQIAQCHPNRQFHTLDTFRFCFHEEDITTKRAVKPIELPVVFLSCSQIIYDISLNIVNISATERTDTCKPDNSCASDNAQTVSRSCWPSAIEWTLNF
jgi:hypothetical protein